MNRRTPITAIVAACLAVGIPAPLPALRAQGAVAVSRAMIKGNVIDDADDRPISGATVSIESLRMSMVTDSSGTFRLIRVPAGRHLIIVKRLGFSPLSSVINVGPTDTLDFDFALVKQATNLPEVAVKTTAPVTGKLAEFDERSKTGMGRFITKDILDKNQQRRVSEVLATIPGPRIVRGTGNNGWVASSVGASAIQRRNKLSQMDISRGADPNQCYAAVMLDGNRIYSGRPGEQLFDVNSIDTKVIAGIEYYRDAATVPMKFNVTGGGETCGLVIIWTK